ncbi:hypothetical protein GCM10010294_16480 [Streptomyces griseoloalbus]|nr:hypothetical protein GCM10010294_16480 [Streptomyces griseoloalbus]
MLRAPKPEPILCCAVLLLFMSVTLRIGAFSKSSDARGGEDTGAREVTGARETTGPGKTSGPGKTTRPREDTGARDDTGATKAAVR